MAGQTTTSQYDYAEMQLVLAWSGPVPKGGYLSAAGPMPLPALIDASGYAGIQFWLWVSPDTAESVGPNMRVALVDKNQTHGGGVCDSTSTGVAACGNAAAVVTSSLAQKLDSGRLFADGGSVLNALSGGWQHVWASMEQFHYGPQLGRGKRGESRSANSVTGGFPRRSRGSGRTWDSV